MIPNQKTKEKLDYDQFKSRVLEDYRLAYKSRACSLLGRREVLSGKGSFGIFGDGKELPQLVINHFFETGDFRAGYYRDQTLLMGQDFLDEQAFFHAIYATTEPGKEPMSSGRQMGGHFMTPLIDEKGEWLPLHQLKNHSADLSPTAAQMPRMLGLAQASKVYRALDSKVGANFSNQGNEICWGTIGNASTAEGLFFETINAAGVLQVPLVLSVYDDDYGISVHNKDQITKESISKALEGFQRTADAAGIEIIRVNGWDYTGLINAYDYATKLARNEHIPVLVHITELTQPLGHSTSGSHERYKSKERLAWENEYDCNTQFKQWILRQGIATETELAELEKAINTQVRQAKTTAWQEHNAPINSCRDQLLGVLQSSLSDANNNPNISIAIKEVQALESFGYKELLEIARALCAKLKYDPALTPVQQWIEDLQCEIQPRFSSHLYTLDAYSNVSEVVAATYEASPKQVDGRIVLRDNFDALFEQHPELLIFGEDVGKIGDVNQGLEGLQKKYGALRIADTGIREATIIGQGIGMALRGLRPIAEIQYLDYVLYALQTLSDDLASLSYRTHGQQIAPLIIRTRGHRLEGIWHSGSPMGGMLHLLRGIYILTPRNMTQAAAMYNSLLQLKQPAVVIESLNGYRLKEPLPQNLGQFTLSLGESELLVPGRDLTIVSYGSTLRMALDAAERLKQVDIHAEVIDLQSLIPLDLTQNIKKSLQKTNRLLIVDEDVPGGASAYILQQLIDEQGIYPLLDSAPKLVAAQPHRPAYGTDGDYFSKPSIDDIYEAAYQLMHEVNPDQFPPIQY
jgi:2-oxoisovalerate dehydrogenase E1 component